MSPLSLFILLSITLPFTQAAIPSVDFNALFNQFLASGTSWCTTCAAFQTQCVMGCAGDTGGGGVCPASACPNVYTFTSTNNVPTWNLKVATTGSPYRAFSYIPLCVNAATCTDPFIFSFSVKYIPNAGAITPIFNNQQDYLKLLFWGDGNNILGVKNGQLLGLPNGGSADLPGTVGIGTNNAFATTFPINTWVNLAVKFTYANARATLAFYMNGQPIGTTTGNIGTSSAGLQFGAYVWGDTFFGMQYANLAITAATAPVPNPTMPGMATTTPTVTTAPTTVAPTTKAPTTKAPTGTTAPTTKTPTTAPTAKTPTTAAPTAVTTPTTTAPTSSTLPDTLKLINPSTSIPQLGSFTVTVQYSAKATRVIAIDVLQPANSYTKWGGGSTTVNAGTGTVAITVTMTGIAAAGPGYILQYSSVDPTKYQNGTNPAAYATAFVLQNFAATIVGTATQVPTIPPTDAPTTIAPTTAVPVVTPAIGNGFVAPNSASSSIISMTSIIMMLISSCMMILFL